MEAAPENNKTNRLHTQQIETKINWNPIWYNMRHELFQVGFNVIQLFQLHKNNIP